MLAKITNFEFLKQTKFSMIASLLHKRKFLASTHEKSNIDNWQSFKAGGLFFYLQSDLEYCIVEENNRTLVLLGYLVDYNYPLNSTVEILKIYLKQSNDLLDFIKMTFSAGGRWAFFYKDSTSAAFLNDATGMLQLFYSINDELTISSSEMLLSQVLKSERSENVNKNFISHFKNTDNLWFPNNSTNFDDIKCLLPNYYFECNSRNCVRFWPQHRLILNYNEAILLINEILSKVTISIQNKFKNIALGTTAGFDSRLTLGYFLKYQINEFVLFTTKHRSLNSESPDIAIPKTLGELLKIKHLIIEQQPTIETEFINTYLHNNANYKQTFVEMANNMYLGYPEKYLATQSVLNEIARQRYPYIPYCPDLHDVCHFTGYGSLPFAKDEFSKWLNEPRSIYKNLNLHVEDLFFMEQRMGRWNSSNHSDWDMVQNVFEPWNIRDLWLICMSIGRKHKRHIKNDIYRDLFNLVWPQYNLYKIEKNKQINYFKFRSIKLISKTKRTIKSAFTHS